MVVGEYERAFFGDQLTELLPLVSEHGVQLWLPKPIVASTALTRLITLVMLLGAQSKRESAALSVRVVAAMQAQTVASDGPEPEQPDAPVHSLAEWLRQWFFHAGDEADLDEAVGLLRRAVDQALRIIRTAASTCRTWACAYMTAPPDGNRPRRGDRHTPRGDGRRGGSEIGRRSLRSPTRR